MTFKPYFKRHEKWPRKRVQLAAGRRERSSAVCPTGWSPGINLVKMLVNLVRLNRAPGARGRPGAAAAHSQTRKN